MNKIIIGMTILVLGSGVMPMKANTKPIQVMEEQVKHKVVFHLTTDVKEEQMALFNNLKNILQGWEGKVVIEVVAHGPGISLFMKENPLAKEALHWHEHYPVKISICENTLKQKNISKNDLVDGFNYVPMGVAHVVELQEKGYAYIKANF